MRRQTSLGGGNRAGESNSRRRWRGRVRGVETQPVALFATDAIRPARRDEMLPILVVSLLLAAVALIVCLSKNYLLLYGDAVAHLGIARRILDARYPGLAQLGGVWLPLPHLLMLPFIGRMEWWQNGMAGAWPSLAAYVLSVLGCYRLARRLVPPLWALIGTAFYALNPNLLFLATTAMTEPLFLAIILWLVLLTMECLDAMREARWGNSQTRLIGIGLLNVAAVYTRYDGWILAALVWCFLAAAIWKRRAQTRLLPAFACCTLLTIAAPIGWFAYNQHFYGDWLDFMRGPYSAAAIEKKTSPPGAKHYRGWHNPAWALLFYTRTAQVDSTAWELGFLTLPLALLGGWRALRERLDPVALLLWFPLPFYVYSIGWGSVPIFIPQLYPHSFYNARYGMEMLPAIAIFGVVALAWTERRLRAHAGAEVSWALPVARLLPPLAFAFAAVNCVVMMAMTPLVLKEGIVNSVTRIAFEREIARALESFPAGSRILISTNDHIGAVQRAGIPLRTLLSDNDRDSYQAALAAPGERADYVIAIDRDAVSGAVRAHPQGLTELTVLCTLGQPCARVYKATAAPDPMPMQEMLSR